MSAAVRAGRLGLAIAFALFSTGSGRADEDLAADAEAEMARADRYMAQGDFDAAAAHYNAARLLAPDRPGPYRGLGMATYAAGRCDEAIPALEKYVDIKRGHPWPQAVRALDDCRARTAPRPTPPPELAPAPPPRRTLPPIRQARPATSALDPATVELLREARLEYERHKIDVCGSGPSYEFCTVHGRITENEFIRRFKRLTGSHELDRFLTLRNKGAIAVWATFGLLGVGAVAAGGALYNTPCKMASDDAACRDASGNPKPGATYTTDTAKYLLYGGIIAWATSTIGYLVYGGLSYDGKLSDHLISEFDARIYVERHNRALDARLHTDAAAHGHPLPPVPLGEPQPSSALERRAAPISTAARLRLVPYLGAGGLGVVGRF